MITAEINTNNITIHKYTIYIYIAQVPRPDKGDPWVHCMYVVYW